MSYTHHSVTKSEFYQMISRETTRVSREQLIKDISASFSALSKKPIREKHSEYLCLLPAIKAVLNNPDNCDITTVERVAAQLKTIAEANGIDTRSV